MNVHTLNIKQTLFAYNNEIPFVSIPQNKTTCNNTHLGYIVFKTGSNTNMQT